MEEVSFEKEFNEEYIPDNKIHSFYDKMKHTVVFLMVTKEEDKQKQVGDGSNPWIKRARESAQDQMIFGTGIVLFGGFILTANNVVEGAKRVFFRHLEDTNFYACAVLKNDESKNLALLSILSGKFKKYIKFGEVEDIQPGRNVYCISNPGLNNAYAVYRDTFTIGQIAFSNRLIENNKYIQINNCHGSQTGSMGSPIFSSSGTLIGLVSKIDEPFDFATPVDVIEAFLNQL